MNCSFTTITATLLLLAGAGASICAAEEERPAHDEKVSIPAGSLAAFGITTEQVGAMVVGEPVMAPGWAAYDPAGEFQVSASAPGRVTRIAASVGSLVKEHEVLVEILSPAFVEAQNQWLIKRMAVATAALAIEQSRAAVERGKQTGDGISKAEQQRREFDLKQVEQAKVVADTELAAAKNTVRVMAGQEFDFIALAASGEAQQTLALRAAGIGTVIEVAALLGQQVAPEGMPLVTVADPSRLWVVVQIPEALLSHVQVGSQVEVTGFAGGQLATGAISQMAPEIDPHTRTGRARIAVTAAGAGTPALRPGMYVQAAIVPQAASAQAPVLAVPEAALQMFEGKQVVFVAVTDGGNTVFRPRPVMVGPVLGGHASVLSGLKAGESIVVQGAFLLTADLGKEGAAHED